MTLHTDTPERFARALESLEGSYDVVAGGTADVRDVVLERVDRPLA